MQVFISHAQADRELALNLVRQLEQSDVAVWNPYNNIFPGDNWAKEIGAAIEASDLMVVLISSNTKNDATISRDVQYALTSGNYRGRVVPVLVDYTNFVAGSDVPWVLLRMDPIHVTGPEWDFGEVVERIRSTYQTHA